METLRIHTAIHSRYQVLDASGRLPFSIVFGLCRRSPADKDSRPLILDTKHSALDVPYALRNGLLTLNGAGSRIDLGGLEQIDGKQGTYLTLSSAVDRTEEKFEAFTVYHYQIDPRSELGSRLESGKEYTIQLGSEDLGVEWYAHGARGELLDDDRKPTRPSESAPLVNSKPSAGKASFKVVSSLPWPPKVETHIRLTRSSPGDYERVFLEVSVLNSTPEPVSVQTCGTQRYLTPWGPFQPEPLPGDIGPRIVDYNPERRAPIASLEVIDTATDTVVRGTLPPNSEPLTSSKQDQRPWLDTLVTLKAGEPLIRRVDISRLLAGLRDGRYAIRMRRQGMWWCRGDCEEFEDGGDGRVPRELGETVIPPLVLECDDVAEFRIEGGRCVG